MRSLFKLQSLRKLGHIESFVHFHKTLERGREKELEKEKKG